MANVEITRISEIVVDTVSKNTYGDLVFTDKGGVQYKVGAKRVSYFENIIQPGAAVQLNYAMSGFGKQYIYNATQIKDHIPPAQEPHPTEQIPKKDLPSPSQPYSEHPPSKPLDTKNRAFALSYSKDLFVARIQADPTQKVEPMKILAVAEIFDHFLNGMKVDIEKKGE